MMLPREVFIAAAKRTPVGSFNGKLMTNTAVQLATTVVKDICNGIADKIDHVIFGNVLSAGVGQAPARQVCLAAGLPESAVCTTVNKVCSSGLKAVIMGAQAVALGDGRHVVAGGMESMSNAPFYLDPRMRRGIYGQSIAEDAILRDGLLDPRHLIHMGVCAEETATEHQISREEQDGYCIRSYELAAEAWKSCHFKDEIVAVQTDKGLISEDEEYKKIDLNKVTQLKSAFQKGGSVTAANSSKINDGASAVLLTDKKDGQQCIGRIIAYAEAECAPKLFTIAPSRAVPLVLERAFPGKPWRESIKNISLFEINEAFSVVALVNQRLLGIPLEKLNVHGGAVAFGHPIGSSGCRILVSLLHSLNPGELGIAAVCNGGGGASALLVERL